MDDSKVIGCSVETLTDILQTSIPAEAQTELIKPNTVEEVRSTMFSIDGEKAPGPDGYTAHFLKVTWPIVHKDVTEAVFYFFQTKELHPAFNSTIVVLVTKCQNPSSIREYMPVTCCSVIYNCIKILAN